MGNPIERYKAMNEKLIKQVDKLLAAGDWEKSSLLKAYKKKFLTLREEAQSILEELVKQEQAMNKKSQPVTEKPGHRKVYISLHQAQGKDLVFWEQLLNRLPQHSVNRPVYGTESEVNAFIRTKSEPVREAYVVILVDEKDIIRPYKGRKVTDRLGHELLTLKERSVKLENIVKFVHNNKHYYFEQGRLQLIG